MSLFNTNKYIPLSFTSGTWSTTATVSVQFPVKEIIVRSIVYEDNQYLNNQADAFTNANSNAILSSDLVQNNILGIVNMASFQTGQFEIGSYGPILRYCYNSPQQISGVYTFSLYDLSGRPTIFGGTYHAGNLYKVGLILEFIQYEDQHIRMVSN